MSGPNAPLGQPHRPHASPAPQAPHAPGYPMPQGPPPPGYGFPPPPGPPPYGQPPPRRKGAGPALAIAGGVMAVLLIIGGAFYFLGPGKSKKSGGTSSAEKGWTSGDVRTVSENTVCRPMAGLAARLVPKPDPQGPPSTRTDVADCHWRNLSSTHSRHRSLSVTVLPHSPSHGLDADQSAAEVAANAFRQTVQSDKGGPMGERVKDSRSVPGLGDEAVLVYSVGITDAGIARLVVRKGNVEMDVTYQGSDSTLRGNPAEGYYPVTKPLSRPVAEQGALTVGRQLVGEFT
jgi:hypothetical protein